MTTAPPDLDDAFFAAFVAACERLGIDPLALIRVLYSESSVMASAHNIHGDASGILQAMPQTLLGLGWTRGHEAFRQLSAAEQVPYLERYYTPYAAHCRTDALCYVATFLPALLTRADELGPAFPLCGARGPLAWAYGANRGLDIDRDGVITVADLGRRLELACRGARWDAIVWRLRQAMGLEPAPLQEAAPTERELPALEEDGGAARHAATGDSVEQAARDDVDRRHGGD